MTKIHVRALWDAEAGVWVAESVDVPGLVTEASGLDSLKAKLDVLIPELLAANSMANQPSVPVELVAEYQERLSAASV
ncbi:MAG: DUF1902 domain-containing protein [Terriglobales bacterium]